MSQTKTAASIAEHHHQVGQAMANLPSESKSDDVREAQVAAKRIFVADPSASRVTLRASAKKSNRSDSPFLCSVTARKLTIESAGHEAIGISYDEPCSGELLLGALAACAQTSVQIIANATKVPIRAAEVYIEGDVDFSGTLGVSREVPIGFTNIRLRFEVDAPEATEAQLRSLKRKVDQYCIITQTLLTSPKVVSTWQEGIHPPTLYQFVFSSSCEKVRRSMHRKQIAWRTIEVDWYDRTELERISGQRLTPVLQHAGGTVGPDSMAVMEYLERSFEGPTLFPNNSWTFCHRVNDYVEDAIFPLAMMAFLPWAAQAMPSRSKEFSSDVQRLTGKSSDVLMKELSQTVEAFCSHLQFFEPMLNDRLYLAGEHPSAADFSLHANLWFAENNPEFRKLLPLPHFPNLRRWKSTLEEAFHTVIPF